MSIEITLLSRIWLVKGTTMIEMTLPELAKRLMDLEKKVADLTGKPPSRDWRRTVGMFEGSQFMAEVDADILAAREAEREAARSGMFE
jgi:hypothetical protein